MSKARIRDVAEKAKVSPRTVTRVLRGGEKVAAKTRKCIEEALKELDYSPNIIARALKTKRTNLIGIVMEDVGTEILSKKLVAFERTASRNDYRILLGITEGEFRKEQVYINDFIKICDGILLFVDWPFGMNRDSLDMLRDQDKPYVIVDGDPKEKYSVSIDRQIGVFEGVEQSHKKYRHFTFLGSKIGPKIILIEPEKYYYNGYAAGDEIAGQKNTLVCCSNDHLGMGLLKRLLELGVRVPEEIGLFGFDDDSYTPFTYKALSTISQPVEDLARETFEMLFAQLDGKDARKVKPLPTKFIKRDTT
jgi:LacI family transcriptional regulator